MAYKASRAYGAGGERRGYINFRVHVDDSELRRALSKIQSEGQDEVRKLINEMMIKAKKESEDFLLDQRIHNRGTEGPKAGQARVRTPFGDENAYVRIADSLKISDDALFVRLFSAPYPSGYLSEGGRSRSGFKVAMAHAAGVEAFNYSKNTPLLVKSSVYWFMKTGKAMGYTRRPTSGRLSPQFSGPPQDWREKQHPGFQQVDFIGVAQDYMEEHFEDEAERMVAEYLRRQGFV